MDGRGIISAGTWLVDNENYRQYRTGNLTTISRVEKDWAAVPTTFRRPCGLNDLPLYAGGRIGRDALGITCSEK